MVTIRNACVILCKLAVGDGDKTEGRWQMAEGQDQGGKVKENDEGLDEQDKISAATAPLPPWLFSLTFNSIYSCNNPSFRLMVLYR